ncbi:MAG: C40 family peptidase, partial [Firmicutes bacterium]|nr:C40 family peptidase [Bacillota bacterium]
VAKDDEWYKIVRTNGDVAYVYGEYVKGGMLDYVAKFDADKVLERANAAEEVVTEEVEAVEEVKEETVSGGTALYALVNTTSRLNLRSEATTDSAKVQSLYPGEVLDVIQAGDNWVKVESEAGNIGFVAAEYVSVRSGEKPSRSLASGKGESVVAYAKQFLGTPYVWGGTSLTGGVDCSGFVYSVYKHFGITLNRTSYGMASNGIVVDKANLQPGDLILFDTTGVNDGGISHVGIYIGNDQYIHSSSGKAYSVIISDLYNAYGKRTYVTARRVLR